MHPRTLILILFLIVTAPETGSSQKLKLPGDEELAKTQCSVVTIEPAASKTRVSSFPFSHIKVIDERINKSSSGYFHARQSGDIYKICHANNLNDEIHQFLIDYFSNSLDNSGDTLLVQVKKFWLRNYDVLNQDSYSRSVRNGIDVRIEFYLRQGSCNYALYKFDSVIIQDGKSQEIAGRLMSKALLGSIQRLQQLSPGSIAKRRCISASQIDSFNSIYHNLPVFTEKVLRKGVYLTIGEFKNNKPSYEDFTVALGTSADLIYVKGRNIKDSVITDALGFSDGNSMFIKMTGNFYPIYKCGDNFELYGIQTAPNKGPAHRSTLPMDMRNTMGMNMMYLGVGTAVSSIFNRLDDIGSSKVRLYALDLESGKLINPSQSYYNSQQHP
jgi:hypothetical protein